MSSQAEAIIDMNQEENPRDQLVFQDFSHSIINIKPDILNSDNVQTHVFTNFPNPHESDGENTENLIDGKKSQATFWTFEYYQLFFDVDTKQVLNRIIGSMYPNPRINYLKSQIQSKPDFYGPFWICTTLVMSIAIAGNLANYFSAHSVGGSFKWQYDFHKVTIATIVIYSYWLLMPLLVYSILRWRGNKSNYKYSDLLCLYGYSLSIFIPISILWLIPIVWLKWILVLVGMVVSGVVLSLTIYPTIKERKVALGLITFILFMHGLLSVGFMLYFFSAVPPYDSMMSTTSTVKLNSTLAIPTSSMMILSTSNKTIATILSTVKV